MSRYVGVHVVNIVYGWCMCISYEGMGPPHKLLSEFSIILQKQINEKAHGKSSQEIFDHKMEKLQLMPRKKAKSEGY